MARNPYTQNSYVGGGVPATLTSAIGASDTSISLTFGTTGTWTGLGVGGGFFLSIDYDNSAEEKVWVPTASINWALSTVTITVQRGQDGTTAVSHGQGAKVVPVISKSDIAEANFVGAQTIGQIQSTGDLLYLSLIHI